MLSGGPATTALARDTVFAAVMIILNGMVGLCLLVDERRYPRYQLQAWLPLRRRMCLQKVVSLPTSCLKRPWPPPWTAILITGFCGAWFRRCRFQDRPWAPCAACCCSTPRRPG